MLDTGQLALHGLALRQLGSAPQVAGITGQPEPEVTGALQEAVASGAVMDARGSFMITPAGSEQLSSAYPQAYAALRTEEITAVMEKFETGVNKQLLKLTTEWQTRPSGEPNDHTDLDYDSPIIDKIARVCDRTAAVLAPVIEADPLTGRFLDRMSEALTRAEGGETSYISGVRVDSVHTIWFQMHEHLLRMTGRERPE